MISEYLKYLPGSQEDNREVYTQAGSECSGQVMNWGVERIGGKKSGALCKGRDKPRTPFQVWGLNREIHPLTDIESSRELGVWGGECQSGSDCSNVETGRFPSSFI